MTKTLIVPDIHERLYVLEALEPKMASADRVVFLGDFWDTWHPAGLQAEVAQWLRPRLHDSKYTALWGNHDCQYAFKHLAFRCSGRRELTQIILDQEMSYNDWRQFKVFTWVGPFVVSHAGFHPFTVDLIDKGEEALEAAFSGKYHELWGSNGPTWLRWWDMMKTDFPQIVGHTPNEDVRAAAGNWCIDTDSKHVAWVDEDSGSITIEKI